MTSTATEAKTARFDWGGFIKKYAIVGILILFIIIMTILSEGSFIQPSNLINVVNQIAPIGIIATGMTFVIIINGIDLSVGSIVAMSAVVSASLAQLPTAPKLLFPGLQGLPIIVALLAGLGIGALLGAINGGLVAGFGIPPFIATLGMMTAARGAANIYADNGRPVSYLTPEFNFLGSGDFLFIPMPIFLLLLVGVVAHFALNYTRFGRHTYALGGNEQAARVSGINIKMLTLGIFTLSGFLAGLAGMVLAARVQ
ncbi:MAG: ABC transporter permease, partial [Propionibacteriaceae bacterium]|nr:ABC transporter permease [Propionibacteriaceae bacterium]